MKILSYVLIAALIVFAFYGFLIFKEYARYFVRSLQLKLDSKLESKLPSGDSDD